MPDTPNNPGREGGGALVSACRLYRKTSARGGDYLTGRRGGLRVLVMPKRAGDDGEHSHTLLIGEAGQREGGEAGR